MKKKNILLLLGIFQLTLIFAQQPIEYTKAGYLSVPNAGRGMFDFNVGWRFMKADVTDAQPLDFDDSSWALGNCPYGLELMGTEASGGVNYHGAAWYRKHFTPSDSLKGRQLRLHIEGVIGKCKIWVNAELTGENYGVNIPFQLT